MKQIARMFGSAILYGACLIAVLFLVLKPSGEGMLERLGNVVSVAWVQDDAGGFNSYDMESEESFPIVACHVSGSLVPGTYDLSEIVSASDGGGNPVSCRFISIECPDKIKIECTADMTQAEFTQTGIYELEVSTRDAENRETVKRILIPVSE